MNTDKEAIRGYQKEVKRLKDEMKKNLIPIKAELGYYLQSERDKGRTVSNILDGMGINNRVLIYECLSLADYHTPVEYVPDLPLAESFSVAKTDEVITVTPLRPILPEEWTFPNAQVKKPYNNPLELENEEPYLAVDLSQNMNPLRREILQGSLGHLLT